MMMTIAWLLVTNFIKGIGFYDFETIRTIGKMMVMLHILERIRQDLFDSGKIFTLKINCLMAEIFLCATMLINSKVSQLNMHF